MIGKRSPQPELFDVGYVWDLPLDPRSFHGQLARAADRLFKDEDFAACYKEGGRPSVPPSQLALLTLLQHHAQVSDQEAVDRTAFDVRWAAVLRRPLGKPLCVKSTLQLFRAHLILHDAVLRLFRQSILEAKRAGLLTGATLRVALDTKPIEGRGAAKDTYNLLATGIKQLGRALARAQSQAPACWAAEHDFQRYWSSSVKGQAELDWSDAAARQQLLTEIVTDARRLLRLTGNLLPTLAAAAQPPVRAAAALLEQLLLQDVQETASSTGPPTVELRDGTTPGRHPSASDPDQRHGRKSKSRCFKGHKASIAIDLESQIVVEVDVLAGDAPDARGALEQVQRAEEHTGLTVTETLGDCAYGGGTTRQEFTEAARPLLAKAPPEPANGGRFRKSAFRIDLEAGSVTCPAGHTITQSQVGPHGERRYRFGAHCADCPLRAQCTTSQSGRQVEVQAHEAELQAARAFKSTAAGKAVLRERVAVEHGLARLAHLGIGQARYVGRRKTRFQLLLAATVANLRRTWNWLADRGRGASGGGRTVPAPGPVSRPGVPSRPSLASLFRSLASAARPQNPRWASFARVLRPVTHWNRCGLAAT